jgi:hypothetical protein
LVPSEEPSEKVWQGLEQQLRREHLIKNADSRRFFAPAARAGWFARLVPGFAYSAVFAMALGVVYVYTIAFPKIVPPPVPAAPNPPLAQLFEKVPAEKRAVYVNNLNEVESSIQHLQTFLAAHPEDPFAREALFNTYQEKSRLWEDIVRWEEF